MPKGLMKRLSKSATDLSPCKRKKHSNSEDEEFEEGSRSESARTDGSDEEVERPGSAQSSVSVPTISLIGSTKRIKYQSRGRSRSEHHHHHQHHQPKIPHERSIAAEIAAVPKTSHFGIFGLLKQKFGLHARERESMVRSENCQQVMVEEDATPQVVRIKCQADNYQADTESVGSPSPHRKPQVIRRKVESQVSEREDKPEVIRHQTSDETGSGVSDVSAANNKAALDSIPDPPPAPHHPPESQVRQDSRSSFMSILTRSRTESVEDPVDDHTVQEPPQHTDSPDCFHSTEDLKQYSYYTLCIHLKAGHDLAARDSCGTSDPYVKFLINSKIVYKSKTVYKDLNPFWDEKFELTIEDISVPMDIKVYDYDWGLRDDFMGQAQISFSPSSINHPTDIVLTLIEAGESEYLGQISLEVNLVPVSSNSPEHRRAPIPPSGTYTSSPARGLELAARKLKPGTWDSKVHIVLVEGKDLLAMDEEGTSDPYCKFRLGSDRYKTKTVYETLNPKWQEQFELYLYEDSQELEITVWDRDQRSKDDFMGRTCIELHLLKREVSHPLWLNLEDGAGKLFLIVTISGTTNPDSSTFLTNWDHSEKTAELREKNFNLRRTFKKFSEVGSLVVKVYRAKGLYAADLGGHSDPFCVLELDNTRVQTHTEYKTLDPVWQKVFQLSVTDVHSVLHITVYDEDKNHKTEFLGKLCIPLLNMKNKVKRWYALKDKAVRGRAKGNFPQIQLEFDLVWNPLRATYVTLNPKLETHVQSVEKFKRHVFITNVMRIKSVILAIIDFGSFIQSCLEWEDIPRSIAAFLIFMTVTYYFEPYMAPIGLLLIFFKYYLVSKYIEQKPLDSSDVCMSDEDEDNEEKEEDKEEKKSIKEKLQAIQDVTAMVQNALGYAAHFFEGIKNTFNFSVPFLSWLAIIILSIVSIFLFFIPCRVIIMLWGINKFSRQLIMPNTVPNNELLDFLSRVPNDEMLKDARELKLMYEENMSQRKPTAKKKS